ncbi:hypothetical protein EYF80_052498 [Liparis tanakae]|uniref:Uncharacterized protein n=1 Tax=Liparis tanakae TaxID=230148 RepID=A0A4Z2FAE6_9TELE|nr:hypothetical protein EYF80_052498 [Liparis tanakae]
MELLQTAALDENWKLLSKPSVTERIPRKAFTPSTSLSSRPEQKTSPEVEIHGTARIPAVKPQTEIISHLRHAAGSRFHVRRDKLRSSEKSLAVTPGPFFEGDCVSQPRGVVVDVPSRLGNRTGGGVGMRE